ncbi:hypothetical protein EDC27_0695 [Desulfosoma caldarium]|uniref:Uncharacterized protein n=1 Tax=Desulfosoma caldarium TaxID=610254 RepID=A0A3N1VHZ3_9BACT|nr:hypothetical protein EDC27_0695 [Desulfosoma caldarium]
MASVRFTTEPLFTLARRWIALVGNVHANGNDARGQGAREPADNNRLQQHKELAPVVGLSGGDARHGRVDLEDLGLPRPGQRPDR